MKVIALILNRHCLLAIALLLGATTPLLSQVDQLIYTDSRQNNWEDWGWAQLDYESTNFVHSGSKAISITITNTLFQGIYFHHPEFDTSTYGSLSFWIHGGTNGGQLLKMSAVLGTVAQVGMDIQQTITTGWQQIAVPLASLNVANKPNFTGFWIQGRINVPQPTFYLDDVTLIGAPPTPANVTIDVLKNQHAISDLIYGVAFATSNRLKDLNVPLHRSGGNAETRYNWQINAHNRGSDFYFESVGDSPAVAGAGGDEFVSDSKNGGAEAILTVPMIGWVAKLGEGGSKLASYSITNYGPQTAYDTNFFQDAGNGIGTNGVPITWNDPTDANVLTDSTFQQDWVKHLTNRWGLSTNGGVRYYCMDNEYSLWHSTHRDVHPVGNSMQEIRDKFFDYAAKVKAVDPSAKVLAPEEWGWSGYFWSGYDQQWSGANKDFNQTHFPDRTTNAGWDYMPWFLDQARQRATNTGQRLLDYFTLHYYPQGGEFSDDTDIGMQLLRNKSTRSLWDTNYVDTSWINSVVKLIPRMKGWVTNYYPGTKIGITEYNWGAEDHINGATAQADVLGIFGREGLDCATRWTTPAFTTPTYKAMKMFRNYDGNKSIFGDTSVSASGPNPDLVSTFAAVRTNDGALTIMVINKQMTNVSSTVTLTNFLPDGVAQVWQLTSANVISNAGSINFAGNMFSNQLPQQSITLYVLPPGGRPSLTFGQISSSNTFDFWLNGELGQRYVIENSSNLANWISVQTNTLTNNPIQIVLPKMNTVRALYRARWLP